MSALKIPQPKKLHAPANRGALCSIRVRGPFASSAALVSCRSCLRWPDAVALAYNSAPASFQEFAKAHNLEIGESSWDPTGAFGEGGRR